MLHQDIVSNESAPALLIKSWLKCLKEGHMVVGELENCTARVRVNFICIFILNWMVDSILSEQKTAASIYE